MQIPSYVVGALVRLDNGWEAEITKVLGDNVYEVVTASVHSFFGTDHNVFRAVMVPRLTITVLMGVKS